MYVLIVLLTLSAGQAPFVYALAGGIEITECGQRGSAYVQEAQSRFPGSNASFQCLKMIGAGA